MTNKGNEYAPQVRTPTLGDLETVDRRNGVDRSLPSRRGVRVNVIHHALDLGVTTVDRGWEAILIPQDQHRPSLQAGTDSQDIGAMSSGFRGRLSKREQERRGALEPQFGDWAPRGDVVIPNLSHELANQRWFSVAAQSHSVREPEER
jgi:hypothetical protein